MKNFVQPGEYLTLVVPYAAGVTAGQGVQVGALFGVAATDGALSAPVECARCGVFTLTKEPSLAIAVGARVFWDNTNRRVTTASAANLPIGVAAVAAGSSDATVTVHLEPVPAIGGVITRTLSLPVTAVTNTDFTLTLPAGHILAIYERTTTGYGAVSNANLTIGTTVGGNDIVASVDIKSKANRNLTLVDAGSDLITPFAGGDINIRIAQVGGNSATGAGTLIVVMAPTT